MISNQIVKNLINKENNKFHLFALLIYNLRGFYLRSAELVRVLKLIRRTKKYG